MKAIPLTCLAGILAARAAAGEFPATGAVQLPMDRYAAITERSPFALATPVAPSAAPSASFAANWYISGIARLGDADFVAIKSRDLSKQFSLCGHEPVDGVSVASVTWSDVIGQSTVILQKGTETAKLEFNEAQLRTPAAATATPAPATTTPASPTSLSKATALPPLPTQAANSANASALSTAPSTASSGPGTVQRRVRIIHQPR